MPFFVKGEKIILKKDATWVADGVEITHEQTREVFFRSIQWDEAEGQHYLEVGYERIFIEVEDTPYFVMALEQRGATLVARLSNHTDEVLAADRLTYVDGKLYLITSNGLRAKFLSAPFYDLLGNLKEDGGYYFVDINGKRANLAAISRGRP